MDVSAERREHVRSDEAAYFAPWSHPFEVLAVLLVTELRRDRVGRVDNTARAELPLAQLHHLVFPDVIVQFVPCADHQAFGKHASMGTLLELHLLQELHLRIPMLLLQLVIQPPQA